MYFWKDWLKISFYGVDPVTRNFVEITSCSCEPEIARLWKIRDKLKIADPKEPPLEKNKELYLAKLNKHFNDLIKRGYCYKDNLGLHLVEVEGARVE